MGHHRHLQLVDEPCPQVLLDGGRTTAHPDVLAIGGVERLPERGLDSVSHEVERRPALHGHGRAVVVGEHEHRVVEGRVVPPPSRPRLVLTGERSL